MKCKFCNNEITGKPFWVGPKKMGMSYCNYNHYLQDFFIEYPDALSEETKKKMLGGVIKNE